MIVLAEEPIKNKLIHKKVLIVDDDQTFLEELQETLSLNDYDVVSTSNAGEVIELAEKTKPDIILLDLRMPEKSGFQVATELKRISEFVKVPIIAMTGYYNDEQYEPLLRICGIVTCLNKPFNPLEMLKTIKVMLKLHNTQ